MDRYVIYTYIKIDIEMDIWGEMEREGGRGLGGAEGWRDWDVGAVGRG